MSQQTPRREDSDGASAGARLSRAPASALGAFLIGRLAVAVLLIVLTLPAAAVWPSPAWSRSFPDVPPGHPYAAAIADVSARGIMVGYADGRFGPADPVTRQQFAKMVVRAMSYPVSEADVSPFTDVPTNVSSTDPLYPDHYVAVCAAQGITVGKTLTTFAPYDNMTRAQLFTMVARAANLPDPPLSYSPPFGQYDTTHYPFSRKAASAGLLDGLQGVGPTYDFFAPATRGEVCVVLYNLLNM